jgi:branched-chain amino acid transport system permease protein
MMLGELSVFIMNGVIVGSGYGLMGVGLTLIFGLMDVVNFAHGELYMLGAFILFTLSNLLGINFFLAIPIAIALVLLIGVGIDRLTLKPVRNASLLATALVTIGLSIFLQNAALLIWGGDPKEIRSPFSPDPIRIGQFYIMENKLFCFVATIAAIIYLQYLIKRTKFGKAMRATFEDRTAAALMGIKADRIYLYTFCLGSVMAGLAGILLGSIYLLYPTMGGLAIMKAFTVVIMGGMGNFHGAFFSGIMLGVAESLGAGYVLAGYKDAIGFFLVIMVMLFRPQGLFKG